MENIVTLATAFIAVFSAGFAVGKFFKPTFTKEKISCRISSISDRPLTNDANITFKNGKAFIVDCPYLEKKTCSYLNSHCKYLEC